MESVSRFFFKNYFNICILLHVIIMSVNKVKKYEGKLGRHQYNSYNVVYHMQRQSI